MYVYYFQGEREREREREREGERERAMRQPQLNRNVIDIIFIPILDFIKAKKNYPAN